jgi:hypothetical protein
MTRYHIAAWVGVGAAFILMLLAGHALAYQYPPGEEPEHHCYAVTKVVGAKPVEVPCSPVNYEPAAPPVEEPAQPSSPPTTAPHKPRHHHKKHHRRRHR